MSFTRPDPSWAQPLDHVGDDLGDEVAELLRDVEPEALAVAHVRTLVVREADGRYRLWFPQEFSDYLAHVVIDAWEGLA